MKNFKSKILVTLTAFFVVIGLTGCKPEDDVSVDKVTLSETSVTLAFGSTKTLTATVTPVDATKKTVTWTSSDNEVATVNSAGLVTAKSKVGSTVITATADGKSATCIVNVNESGSADEVELYKNFLNYPLGKESQSGYLTVVNPMTQESILVFDGEVKAENYIGTVKPSGNIKVVLDAGKFHTINAVCKSSYDTAKDLDKVAKASAVTYYSDAQGYRVSLAPSNLLGGGTVVFNNRSSYWAAIESTTNDGTTWAVIQPNSLGIKLPFELKKSYSYKIVYKKQISVGGTVIAMVDSTLTTQNDAIYLDDGQKYTEVDIPGPTGAVYDSLAPMVYITNSSGKALKVFKGSVRLAPNSSEAEEYYLTSGRTALFTGWDENSNISTIEVVSDAWSKRGVCNLTATLQKGKCYYITVTANSEYNAENPNSIPVTWKLTDTKDISTVADKD